MHLLACLQGWLPAKVIHCLCSCPLTCHYQPCVAATAVLQQLVQGVYGQADALLPLKPMASKVE